MAFPHQKYNVTSKGSICKGFYEIIAARKIVEKNLSHFPWNSLQSWYNTANQECLLDGHKKTRINIPMQAIQLNKVLTNTAYIWSELCKKNTNENFAYGLYFSIKRNGKKKSAISNEKTHVIKIERWMMMRRIAEK